MRILGIDYGEKRIGLAISDELGVLARELGIYSPKDFWGQIPGFLSEYEVSKVVVGLPVNMDGQPTKKTEEVKAFIKKLETICTIPIVTVDERLSSKMARTISGSTQGIDSLAAQIILQNYLNQKKSSA